MRQVLRREARPVTDSTGESAGSPPPPSARLLVEAGLTEDDESVRLAFFERAFQTDPDDMLAMSWYGLTLARVRRNWSQGIFFCEEALHRCGSTPDLLANLALTWLVARNRREAARMLKRLESMHPKHARTDEVRAALGRRQPPVLPLPRSFFLNRWLGRLRHRWQERLAQRAGLAAS